MLDREYIAEFLKSELEYLGLEIPPALSPSALIEAFYDYLEGNYDAWLRRPLSKRAQEEGRLEVEIKAADKRTRQT